MNHLTPFETQWGIFFVEWNDKGIEKLILPGTVLDKSQYIEEESEPFDTIRQLQAYFDKKLRRFNLPLILHGTEFQMKVWKALQEIPYGETWSYSKLATYIGSPKSARAVGNANHANPLPIIIPCHRVVEKNGGIGGYGGGKALKETLLKLEQNINI